MIQVERMWPSDAIGVFKASVGVWATAGGAALPAPVSGSCCRLAHPERLEIYAKVIEQTVGPGRRLWTTRARGEELGVLFRRKGQKPVGPIHYEDPARRAPIGRSNCLWSAIGQAPSGSCILR